MKKILAVLLVLAMLISTVVLASCEKVENKKQNSESVNDETANENDGKETEEKTEEKTEKETEKSTSLTDKEEASASNDVTDAEEDETEEDETEDDLTNVSTDTNNDSKDESLDSDTESDFDEDVAKSKFEAAVKAINFENYSLFCKSSEKMFDGDEIISRNYITEEKVTKDRCWLKMLSEEGYGEIETGEINANYKMYFNAFANIIKAVVSDFDKLSCESDNTYVLTSEVLTEILLENGIESLTLDVTVTSGKIVITDGVFSQFSFELVIIPQGIENAKLEYITEWNFFDWGTTVITDEEMEQETKYYGTSSEDTTETDVSSEGKAIFDATVSMLDFENFTLSNKMTATLIVGDLTVENKQTSNLRIDGDKYYLNQSIVTGDQPEYTEESAGKNADNAMNHTVVYESIIRAILKDYSKLNYEPVGIYYLDSEVDTIITMSSDAAAKISYAKVTVSDKKITEVVVKFSITPVQGEQMTVDYACVWKFSSWGTTIITDEEIESVSQSQAPGVEGSDINGGLDVEENDGSDFEENAEAFDKV